MLFSPLNVDEKRMFLHLLYTNIHLLFAGQLNNFISFVQWNFVQLKNMPMMFENPFAMREPAMLPT